MIVPRYPGVRIRLRSRNTLALVAAVRMGLRRAGVDREEIMRFSSQAFECEQESHRLEVCRRWAHVEIQPLAQGV